MDTFVSRLPVSQPQEHPMACCCKDREKKTAESGSICEARIDFVFPEVKFPSKKVYLAAGEELLRKLVEVHHENLMKSKIHYLFPTSHEKLRSLIERSADFVVEMCGGPPYYTLTRGEPKMRARHFSVTIDEKAREIWLACYKHALKDVHFPLSVLEEFWQWIESFSIRMINRRTTLEPPRRVPYSEIQDFFVS